MNKGFKLQKKKLKDLRIPKEHTAKILSIHRNLQNEKCSELFAEIIKKKSSKNLKNDKIKEILDNKNY